ncbi:MAG: 30S ribosomal protein S8 [Nitrospiraceae bacterium]|nr:30S ribosomal protein S8 [Nitrospiraceae bacterium]
MVNNDVIATALSKINNAEKAEKTVCMLKPVSKLLSLILTILKNYNYIDDFEEIKDEKGNYIKVKLNGSINHCNAIKPRFKVDLSNYVKLEKRYLPAKDFGFIIVSTNKGLMTHIEAKNQKIGGIAIAYVY